MATATITNKRKTTSEAPAGYICSICHIQGHWIQQCPEKPSKNNKKQRTREHVDGIEPSPDDIQAARAMQAIPPPKCFCGQPSRLKKVKKSKVKEDSRANGNYFFFCAKKKDDPTKCKLARPVEDEIKPKSARPCPFFMKKGTCKKGDKCIFSHDLSNVTTKAEVS